MQEQRGKTSSTEGNIKQKTTQYLLTDRTRPYATDARLELSTSVCNDCQTRTEQLRLSWLQTSPY